MATIQSINPYTEEINAEIELVSETEIDQVIDEAHEAFLTWKQTSFDERKALFLQLADELEKDIEECSRLQTLEMGMLYTDSKAGMEKTVELIRWFANHAEEILGEKSYKTDDGFEGIELYDSLGVIFGIAPWNFPFNQLLRAAVPNILAGNTQIYKHASSVPLCAKKIQSLFDNAGFPKGIYSNVFVSSRLSEHIISNPKIAGVNLTGSERAGSAVGALAGKYLKPSILELGGNDAFVVCDIKNIDAAVEVAVNSRMRNGGQGCNSSKRVIILEKYYDEFCEKYAQKMSERIPGDPFDPATTLQPLSSQGAVDEIDTQVQRAIQSGARVLIGGQKMDKKGFFYPTTVLADVTPEVSSFHEEIFGPVASLIKSSSIEHSIELANNSEFGLSAVAYGDDTDQVTQVAKKLKGGMVFINQGASSKASIPFGGTGKSGYGKENGPEGLKAFANKKVIVF
ncbi:aldehyde dehydrogenase family protein [Candidatus Gracilibacteria bacterium]|nr:aldehyde dehydrogenase family protein [Candidatus Gracilibacteria bacterium]